MRRWSHLRDRQWRLRSPVSSIAVVITAYQLTVVVLVPASGPGTGVG